MASSGDTATTTGCFSAILSRLLCSGSLPTHSSEHLPQLTSTESTHQPKSPLTESRPITTPSSTSGNIVARLMGLDPFPNTPSFSQRTTLDSILRSKSVNYVDFYLPNLEQAQYKAQHEAHDQACHRRVRTSVSFREVRPAFLDPQNHELLILCLDQVDEISRKSEMRLKEMVKGGKKREKEEKKTKKLCKIKEEKPKKVFNGPSPKHKKVVNGPSPRPKNVVNGPLTSASLNRKSPLRPTVSRKEESIELKVRKNRENGIGSRNSSFKSPCVVHRDFPMRVEAQMPDNSERNSSKKSPPRFDKYGDHPCPNFTSRSKQDDQEVKAIKSKTNKTCKLSKQSNYLVESTRFLMEVCRLTEEDTKKGSIWMDGKDYLKLEMVEEICIEFEQEALEMLLSQLVHELGGARKSSSSDRFL